MQLKHIDMRELCGVQTHYNVFMYLVAPVLS